MFSIGNGQPGEPVADPAGVQTPALLFRCLFKRIYFENMSLRTRFLAEQGAS